MKKITITQIIKTIIAIIVIPIIAMSMIVMIKAKINPDKIPDIFGYKPMIVLSGSMETLINPGDLVFVKIVDIDTLKENDIIAFRNERNTVTTHRIVEIVEKDGDNFFKTKGDSNNVEDFELVSFKDVEGIYSNKVPKLGAVLMFFKDPQSVAIVLLSILLIGISNLYVIDMKEKKKE